MSNLLKEKLPEKIKQNELTIASLERLAGLKRNSIQSILRGRSKNPSIKTVQAIAEALNCKVEDLLGEGEQQENKSKYTLSIQLKEPLSITYHDLFQEITNYAISYIKNHHVNPSAESFIQAIMETYEFCSLKSQKSFDQDFAEWVLSRKL